MNAWVQRIGPWGLVCRRLESIFTTSVQDPPAPVDGIFERGTRFSVRLANPSNRGFTLDRAELLIDGGPVAAEQGLGGSLPGQSELQSEWDLSADYPGSRMLVRFSLSDVRTGAALVLPVPLVDPGASAPAGVTAVD